jgi:hypothetical protein
MTRHCAGCRFATWFSRGCSGRCHVALCIRPGGKTCKQYKPRVVRQVAKRSREIEAALL